MNLSRDTHVVVMGDLVGSEDSESVPTTHADFNAAIALANKTLKPAILSPLTITLGDEFQGVVTSLRTGLQIIDAVRWSLIAKHIDCRFVLGLVTLETPLNRKMAWNMMGPGLSRARETLSEKNDPNLYRFSFPNRRMAEGLLDAIGLALTSIERGWTDPQRAVILSTLKDDHETGQIAHDRGVTSRSIYKIREAGDFGLYTKLRAAVQTAIDEIDGEMQMEPAR